MICLGIESSADKVAVGIIDSQARYLANARRFYRPPQGQGIHPREAAEHHAKVMPDLIKEVLCTANLTMQDVDIVAFTRGAGMGPCLRIGAIAARTLASRFDKPIVPVNHQVAHVEIGKQQGEMKDPVVLYVSGGNTQVIAYAGNRYRVFGETIDIPVGNLLDVFGREVGITYRDEPMGRTIERIAETSNSNNMVRLPYVVKGMDVSFSGMLTDAIKAVKERGETIKDVCFSLQETAFAMLAEVTERALAQLRKSEVLVTGGVASNKRLKRMINDMATEHGAVFKGLTADVAIDNGLMIAWLGLLMYQSGERFSFEDTRVLQRYRPEMLEVTWL